MEQILIVLAYSNHFGKYRNLKVEGLSRMRTPRFRLLCPITTETSYASFDEGPRS